jgi:hypothetical protein
MLEESDLAHALFDSDRRRLADHDGATRPLRSAVLLLPSGRSGSTHLLRLIEKHISFAFVQLPHRSTIAARITAELGRTEDVTGRISGQISRRPNSIARLVGPEAVLHVFLPSARKLIQTEHGSLATAIFFTPCYKRYWAYNRRHWVLGAVSRQKAGECTSDLDHVSRKEFMSCIQDPAAAAFSCSSNGS